MLECGALGGLGTLPTSLKVLRSTVSAVMLAHPRKCPLLLRAGMALLIILRCAACRFIVAWGGEALFVQWRVAIRPLARWVGVRRRPSVYPCDLLSLSCHLSSLVPVPPAPTSAV